MSHPVAILLSGGMDSATLLWWLGKNHDGEIHAVSVDYHQRHRVELEFAAGLVERAGIVAHKIIELDLTAIGGSPLTNAQLDVPAACDEKQISTVVPFRNMLFITLAAAYAETLNIHDLYIAPVKDDYRAYRDCRRAFYDSLEQSLRLGASREAPFKLHTPFVEKWKTEVVALGLELCVPYEITHTCYEGRRPACGLCAACVERIQAFKGSSARDPLAYEIDVSWDTPTRS